MRPDRQADPSGYRHLVTIYPDKGHWMDRQDASALAWMSKQERDPTPKRVVWKQDDVTHPSFYWLAVDSPEAGVLVTAERHGQTIKIASGGAKGLRVRLNDSMLDLDKPVALVVDGVATGDVSAPRRIATLHKTLAERGDPELMFSSEIALPAGE